MSRAPATVSSEVLLEARGLTKHFGAVLALDAVDLVGSAGRVHALTGANGAGKSTLMNLLAGVYLPSAGEIHIGGAPVRFDSPKAARAAGVAAVYQELSVLPQLTVAENIWLGREPRTRFGFLDRAGLLERTRRLADDWKLPLEPSRPVASLNVAARQLVEIARALSGEARVLTLDEPTAVLSNEERRRLFGIVAELKRRGLLILFVSHRLDEVFEIADEITVLRNGQRVHHGPVAALDRAALVRHMVGHDVAERVVAPAAMPVPISKLGIRVSLAAGDEYLLQPGEIVGLAGLVGSGRSRLARRLAGVEPGSEAVYRIGQETISVHKAGQAVRAGIVYLTEDRKRDGLFAGQSVLRNATASSLGTFSRLGLLRRAREQAGAAPMLARLRLVATSLHAPVSALSGGNQQKVLFARALLARPRLLVCDEPTRGVDVGAREEIFALIESLAAEGVAVLLVSSDLKELIALSQRLWVVRDARVVAELPAGASEQAIVDAAASGGLDRGVVAGVGAHAQAGVQAGVQGADAAAVKSPIGDEHRLP